MCVSSVNTYSENSENILTEELLLAGLDSSHHPVFAGGPRIEGRAEHATMLGVFKTFLGMKFKDFLRCYKAVTST